MRFKKKSRQCLFVVGHDIVDWGGQVNSSGLQMRCVFQKTSCFERCLLSSCKERECGKERE